MLFAQAFPFLA